MSVSDGQAVNAAVTNAAFLSRLINTSTVGVVTLDAPASGATITNTQLTINDHETRITDNEADIATNTADIATNTADIATLQASLPFSTYNNTSDPTVNDDNLDGYQVGSFWVNVTDDIIWQAVDVTTGAAIWRRVDNVEPGRLAVSSFVTLDFGSTNLTDAAYIELVADSGAEIIKKVKAFYPAGSISYVALGAASSEVDEFLLPPGGGDIEVNIPANSRISLKLISGQDSVTSGVLAVNLLSEV